MRSRRRVGTCCHFRIGALSIPCNNQRYTVSRRRKSIQRYVQMSCIASVLTSFFSWHKCLALALPLESWPTAPSLANGRRCREGFLLHLFFLALLCGFSVFALSIKLIVGLALCWFCQLFWVLMRWYRATLSCRRCLEDAEFRFEFWWSYYLFVSPLPWVYTVLSCLPDYMHNVSDKQSAIHKILCLWSILFMDTGIFIQHSGDLASSYVKCLWCHVRACRINPWSVL